ncbi:MAG: aminodeoxychorismate synthase component I [Methyloligellaceae bacterium]
MTTILIDSDRNAYGTAFLFKDPSSIVTTSSISDVPQALQQIEKAVANGLYAAGFFSYELGYAFEQRLRCRMPSDLKVPLIWFGLFEDAEQLDRDGVRDFLKADDNSQDYGFEDFELALSREQYRSAFEKAQENISSGNIYQLNLTFNAHFQFHGNSKALYRDLKHKQRMNNGAFIQSKEFDVISASPELFLAIDGDQVRTVPMKGTAKRGYTSAQDAEICAELQNDLKSQAENLMIVDLMRNDLGRISEIGEVRVPELFAIETYPTLHQLVSHVTSTLRPGISISEWVSALYPPGSITGAPKVRAMEIIHETESEQRGVYTGTIGMFLPEMQKPRQTYFNVGIRTLTLWPDGRGELGIGSGVVSDSRADDEYDECILKMKFVSDAVTDFQLIETYAYSPEEGYHYYNYHIERLRKSAAYFNYRFDQAAVEAALRETEEEIRGGYYRVRLLLSADGSLSITPTQTEAPKPDGVMRFVISDKRINKDNIYLYHKTTNRNFYDEEHARETADNRCDEVLFLNEDGQITEGSRTNIFIERDGILLTPPIESGLLAGTMRAELIATGRAKESVLTKDDLNSKGQVYLGNSVRGLLKAIQV